MAKSTPTFFQERKAFISRMIKAGIKIQYGKEQNFAKKLFEEWPIDFLNKVKPPFEMNSLAWFLSKDGKKYLQLKLYEFNYKPKREEIIKGEEKIGEDWNGNSKLKSLRKFLS
jgi:hypothetical protein